jgi:chromatin remodeling complex protein RSC6
MQRPPDLYRDSNSSTWTASQGAKPADSLTVTRTGSSDVKVRIALYLDSKPERFKVHPELGALLDIQQETLLGAVAAVWAYVKKERLQDAQDKRVIKTDDRLRRVRLRSLLLPSIYLYIFFRGSFLVPIAFCSANYLTLYSGT